MTQLLVSGRREAKKAQTRAALIEAVFDLVEREGADALTSERVSDAVGIARRTFFNYFPSVDAVLASPGQEILFDVSAALRTRPADEPILDSLFAAIDEVFSLEVLQRLARVWRAVDQVPGARRCALEADSDAAAALAANWAGDRLAPPAASEAEAWLRVRVLTSSCMAAVDIARREWLARVPAQVRPEDRRALLIDVRSALEVLRPAVELASSPRVPHRVADKVSTDDDHDIDDTSASTVTEGPTTPTGDL